MELKRKNSDVENVSTKKVKGGSKSNREENEKVIVDYKLS
jgi:hypothetical protein